MNYWLVNQHRRWGWSISTIFLINLVQASKTQIIMYCMQH